MSDCLTITGGCRLVGELEISGSKNASLPILISTLLTSEECVLQNVPDLEDIRVTLHLLRSLGSEVEYANKTVRIRTRKLHSVEASYRLVKALRASFLVLGPLLSRGGEARVSLPGGDVIGTRPVDLHLKGLERMGADIHIEHGEVLAKAPSGLHAAKIQLDYPSVGATEHLLMTAARVDGESTLINAAEEPEIVELAQFLRMLGAEIEGEGTSTIRIQGRNELSGATHQVRGDRIEAATYLIAGAVTQGEVTVRGVSPHSLTATLDLLRESGCHISLGENHISISAAAPLRPLTFKTAPFPGVATDVQPLFTAALATATGVSEITETVFDNRFIHVAEYRRFGARIELRGRTLRINGVSSLSGAPVEASDIRAAAGLILLGFMAEGVTTLTEVHHLDRGYESFIEKFNQLGAKISRNPLYGDHDSVVGC